MTASKDEVYPLLREFPKYKIYEELKEEAIKEVKKELKEVVKEKKEVDPIQKKRDKRNWKKSLGYYALNPHKFEFSVKNLKTKK